MRAGINIVDPLKIRYIFAHANTIRDNDILTNSNLLDNAGSYALTVNPQCIGKKIYFSLVRPMQWFLISLAGERFDRLNY